MRFFITVSILLAFSGCSFQHPYIGKSKIPFQTFEQNGHHNLKVGLFVFDYDYAVVGDRLELAGYMYCSEGETQRQLDYADIWLHFLILDNQSVVREFKKIKLRTGQLCEERGFKVDLPYKPDYSGIRIHWNWKGYG